MSILKIKTAEGSWADIPAIKGPKGKDGVTPNITFQVEELATGSSATLTKSGTIENPTIKLGLPKGSNGTNADISTVVLKTGSRGTLSGYQTPTLSSSNITINQDSNSGIELTTVSTITVNPGTEGTSWIKTVLVKNASTAVSLGDGWVWSGGEPPTIEENSRLTLCWNNDLGVASLVDGGTKLELFSGTFKHSNDYGETGLVLKVLRNGVELFSLGVSERIECKLANGDEIVPYDPSNSGVGLWLVNSGISGGRIDATGAGYYLSNLTDGFVINCSARWGGEGSN